MYWTNKSAIVVEVESSIIVRCGGPQKVLPSGTFKTLTVSVDWTKVLLTL